MSTSQRLRLPDVRQVYRLIGECQDLGADPLAWRQHLGAGMCRLAGAQVAIVAEAPPPRRSGSTIPLRTVDQGWPTAWGRSQWYEYAKLPRMTDNRFLELGVRMAGQSVTRRREQLYDDQSWYGSQIFALGCHGIDDIIFSQRWVATSPVYYLLSVHRVSGDRRFRQHEQTLVQLVHHELGQLMGRSLADLGRSPLASLTPRLRRALGCLLAGDSEKLAARRLGLSAHTIHEYIGLLYRRFGVRSRGELLAACLRLRITAEVCELPNHDGR